MRLCANTGFMLHLIEPLGFDMDDARMRRAGLDYRDLATVARHPSLDAFRTTVAPVRLLTFSTHHRVHYTVFRYAPGDALLFGPETRGLDAGVRNAVPSHHRLTIPMRPGNRSLNLSNAVAVVAYEAWRQHQFAGSAGQSPL
jgi:tRNA (cytidine/uridine-2'-O-)-methyltransferase